MADYSKDRRNPGLPQCGVLKLDFNGKVMILTGKKKYSYHAVSGRGDGKGNFPLDQASQRKKEIGPIPEGAYWIEPKELVENTWLKPFMIRRAWGSYRIIIHPFPTTETYGRGGMFIHGGDEPGSAGCVDLWTDMDRFVKDLQSELSGSECQIQVTVKY